MMLSDFIGYNCKQRLLVEFGTRNKAHEFSRVFSLLGQGLDRDYTYLMNHAQDTERCVYIYTTCWCIKKYCKLAIHTLKLSCQAPIIKTSTICLQLQQHTLNLLIGSLASSRVN